MLSNQHVNGMTQFVGKLAKLHVLLLDTLEYVIYFDWFEVFSMQGKYKLQIQSCLLL